MRDRTTHLVNIYLYRGTYIYKTIACLHCYIIFNCLLLTYLLLKFCGIYIRSSTFLFYLFLSIVNS